MSGCVPSARKQCTVLRTHDSERRWEVSEKIDIIIPTCKRLHEVQPLIAEIEANTLHPHRVIATCQRVSAPKNRNYGLTVAESSIIVMVDDDMTGFFKGWLIKMIEPIQADANVCMVSARLMRETGEAAHNSGDNYDLDSKWAYVQRKVIPSAAIAFIDIGLKFDEEYIGSGFEDTDLCFQYHRENPDYEFVINNECRLVHRNEMKSQKSDGIWEHNQAIFLRKWNGRMSPC